MFFLITMWQCARSDDPAENYHLNLQLTLALLSFIALFSHVAHNYTGLVHCDRSPSGVFGHSKQRFSAKKKKNTNSTQVDKVSN